MAKVKGSWLAGRVHGSPCKAEGIYVRTNRTSGKMVAIKLCNPYKGPWTDAQKARQVEFGNKSKAVNAWINANKPTSTSSGSAEYASFMEKFKRAGKDNSLFAYLCRTLSMSVSESLKVEETKTQRVEEKLSSMLGLTIDSIVISPVREPPLNLPEGRRMIDSIVISPVREPPLNLPEGRRMIDSIVISPVRAIEYSPGYYPGDKGAHPFYSPPWGGEKGEGDSADIGLKPYAELYRPYGAKANARANDRDTQSRSR